MKNRGSFSWRSYVLFELYVRCFQTSISNDKQRSIATPRIVNLVEVKIGRLSVVVITRNDISVYVSFRRNGTKCVSWERWWIASDCGEQLQVQRAPLCGECSAFVAVVSERAALLMRYGVTGALWERVPIRKATDKYRGPRRVGHRSRLRAKYQLAEGDWADFQTISYSFKDTSVWRFECLYEY